MDMIQVAGLAAQLLVEIGKELAAGPGRFREQYRRIEQDLTSLKPILDRLPAKFNDDALVRELRKGGELIKKCRRVSRWNFLMQKKYSRGLKKLDEEINRFVRVHTMQNYLEELGSWRSGIRRFFSCFACSSPSDPAERDRGEHS